MSNEVKIYCENCGTHQPMRIDSFHNVGGTIWGDICCATCLLVLLTITVPEEGDYEFRKVEGPETISSPAPPNVNSF